jgi:phosphomannomutase
MKDFIQMLRERVTVGIVGGSDLIKQKEQMGEQIVKQVDYSFSENGLVAYKNGELIGIVSISSHLGEENIKEFVNFTLKYLADIDIPVKRCVFVFVVNHHKC